MVREEVVLEVRGCHFVDEVPSRAERGNWPGRWVCGEEAGKHWAMLPGVVVRAEGSRFGKVRVELGGSE